MLDQSECYSQVRCNQIIQASSCLLYIDTWHLNWSPCFPSQSLQSISITAVTLLLPFRKALQASKVKFKDLSRLQIYLMIWPCLSLQPHSTPFLEHRDLQVHQDICSSLNKDFMLLCLDTSSFLQLEDLSPTSVSIQILLDLHSFSRKL